MRAVITMSFGRASGGTRENMERIASFACGSRNCAEAMPFNSPNPISLLSYSATQPLLAAPLPARYVYYMTPLFPLNKPRHPFHHFTPSLILLLPSSSSIRVHTSFQLCESSPLTHLSRQAYQAFRTCFDLTPNQSNLALQSLPPSSFSVLLILSID